MPGRTSVVDAIHRRQHERDADGGRYVDLAIQFRLDGSDPATGGEVLLAVGARWDRRLDDFDGDAETGVVVRIHPGQRAAVLWFSAWLAAHADRRDNPPPLPEGALDADFVLDTDPTTVYSAMLAGGRRAGKTWIAVALAVAYAVMFPGAIVWLVSPADTQDDELRRYADATIAPEWRDRDTGEGFDLCNGSRILFVSAYNPESLKNGEAHFVVLNEGQRMQQRAFVLARGAIVDRSGCVLVCANPPVEAKDQQWVADFAAEAQSGRRAAFYVHFNPLDNPHIDRRALLSLSKEVDERTYEIEVLGKFLTSADAVAYNWDRLQNERPAPDRGDITSMLMTLLEEGDGIRQVVGLDVQRIPYIGGPVYRFFGDPGRDPRDLRDRVEAQIVGEAVLDGGDEIDFCELLLDKGYLPRSTLIVCDASGQWQHSRRRNVDSPPPEWKGRGSFDIIRGHRLADGSLAGWRIVQPDRNQKRNPHITDRVRAFTSMICAGGRRRLFVDPVAAPRTAKALREWKTVHGQASRTQYEAHLGDGASYPIIRFFPRRFREDQGPQRPKLPPPLPPGAPPPEVARALEQRNVAAGAKPLTVGSFLPRPAGGGRRGSRGHL